MDRKTFESKRRSIETPSGRISYVEHGKGPVALFVHGVLLNGYLWRHQLAGLGDVRRCIAVDLLAHGATTIDPSQDVSSTANATMLAELLDALAIEQVDLVGNDSGGGIGLIFAAHHPRRAPQPRPSPTATSTTTGRPRPSRPSSPWRPPAGCATPSRACSATSRSFAPREALGPAYEHPERVTDETIEAYLRPHVASPQRVRDLERFLAAFDCAQTVAVESRLKTLHAPTLVIWGTDDVYFPVRWSEWLARTIPGTRRRVELEGARLFFPEERAARLNDELRAHWAAE